MGLNIDLVTMSPKFLNKLMGHRDEGGFAIISNAVKLDNSDHSIENLYTHEGGRNWEYWLTVFGRENPYDVYESSMEKYESIQKKLVKKGYCYIPFYGGVVTDDENGRKVTVYERSILILPSAVRNSRGTREIDFDKFTNDIISLSKGDDKNLPQQYIMVKAPGGKPEFIDIETGNKSEYQSYYETNDDGECYNSLNTWIARKFNEKFSPETADDVSLCILANEPGTSINISMVRSCKGEITFYNKYSNY